MPRFRVTRTATALVRASCEIPDATDATEAAQKAREQHKDLPWISGGIDATNIQVLQVKQQDP